MKGLRNEKRCMQLKLSIEDRQKFSLWKPVNDFFLGTLEIMALEDILKIFVLRRPAKRSSILVFYLVEGILSVKDLKKDQQMVFCQQKTCGGCLEDLWKVFCLKGMC